MDGARTHILPSAHGFTLIEISIVVAIVLTLLTLGLSFVNAQLSSAAYSITKQRQAAIKDALIAYLGANRRLPCPIDPKTEPITGKAPPDPNLSNPACPQRGVVPFVELGLSREVAQDGWGNLFSYRIYSVNNCLTTPTDWDWGRRECFGEGKDDPDKSTLQIIDVTSPPPINVIAVVVSHGANGLGAWAAQGTQGTPNVQPPETPEACQEAYNARNAANVIITVTASPIICPSANDFSFYKGERQENDDVVAYLTAREALQALVRQGAIKSAVAKVNEDLQYLYELTIASKLSNPPPCAPLPDPSGLDPDLRDPWGNTYRLQPPPPGLGCIYSTSLPTLCKSVTEGVLEVYRSRVLEPPNHKCL